MLQSVKPRKNRKPTRATNPFEDLIQEGSLYERIIFCKEQDRLTAKHFPRDKQQELLRQVIELRKLADKKIQKSFTADGYESKILPGKQHPSMYPMGYCLEIRDQVYGYLEYILKKHKISPLAIKLAAFIQDGGMIHPVRGIVDLGENRVYFQNSIQIGSLILDCAGDAGVGEGQDPVQLHPVNNRVFRNVDSFADYYSVATRYWGCRLIPTSHYFPNLAPFFPEIMLFTSGMIHLPVIKNLFYQNILSGFNLCTEYLRERGTSLLRLPRKWENFFEKRFAQNEYLQAYEKGNANPIQQCEKARDFWDVMIRSPDLEEHRENMMEVISELCSFGTFYESDLFTRINTRKKT